MKKFRFVFMVSLCFLLFACICCAENITWSVDRGVLVISGQGDMPSYAEEAAPWNNSFYQYNSVIINEGITGVGDYAFHLRSSIYALHLPSTLQRIGKYAFSGACMKELSFPYGMQSIGENAFAHCPFLTLVSVPSTLTSIAESAFIGCNQLSAIYVDLANPAYTGHDGVLYNKDMTKLLKYPAARYATDFSIPQTVVSIAPYTFANVQTLQSVSLHDGITELPTGAFAWCPALQTVSFSDNLSYIGDYAFYYCTALTHLELPQTLTYIGNYAFGGCDAIADVLFHGSLDQWQSIGMGHNYILTVIPIQCDYRQEPVLEYNITVLLNGTPMVFDAAPLLQDGRTLVPMRAIFEALGATVTWEAATQTVIASRNDSTITLQIGSPVLKRNDAVLVLDVPAQIIQNRTYVPLRAISECLSCTVTWNGETQTVSITE